MADPTWWDSPAKDEAIRKHDAEFEKQQQQKKGEPIVKKLTALALVAVSALSLSACDLGSETKQSSPDPTSDNIRMAVPIEVIGMPAGFRNVAEACDGGGNMVAVTSRGSDFAGGPNGGGLGSSLFIIANDPRCKK